MAASALMLIQGYLYFFSGLWPITHIRSFIAVTGPKVDVWLAKTIGGLVASIGTVLCFTGHRQNITLEVILLSVLSAGILK